MTLFGGKSFFGMAGGSRGRHRAKRNFQSASNVREEEAVEPGVAACESGPGQLKRRMQQEPTERGWAERGLFKQRSGLLPRTGGIRKFTK